MKVIGIDENGYGPVLGPLVITGASFEIKGNPALKEILELCMTPVPQLKESKLTFRKGKGRETALKILNLFKENQNKIKGYVNFSNSIMDCKVEEKMFCYTPREFLSEIYKDRSYSSDIPLPVNVKPLEFASRVICVRDFNNLSEKGLVKTKILFKEILKIIEVLNPSENDLILCDNLSSTKNYERIFNGFITKEPQDIIPENFSGWLRVKGKETKIIFSIDGDRKYFPVAIASNIGKLLREIGMDFFNRGLNKTGWERGLRISGYRDKKTRRAVQHLKTKAYNTFCLFRNK